ncbi:MAG: zincin-like metallopeptidase domain-containing protein, partial [Oscillospiraceae bacterium]
GRACKGGKSHMAVRFWKFLTAEDEDTKEEKQVPLLRYYNVFHIDPCAGSYREEHIQPLAHNAEPDKAGRTPLFPRLTDAFRGVRAYSSERETKRSYRPSNDTIVLPMMSQFVETAEYYSTAFHEMVHSTGHSNRLNRLTQTAHFGNEEYSKEELVAEIGASAIGQSRRAGRPKRASATAQHMFKVG